MNDVVQYDLSLFLGSFEPESIDAIITSPPFTGLPNRGNTLGITAKIFDAASQALTPEGTITLIVGAAPGNLLLPYHVASDISLFPELYLHSLYTWDRAGTLERDIGSQVVTNDVILHIARRGNTTATSIAPQSVIRTALPGFDYGFGVTTPHDIAAYLVAQVSEPGDLIVDPLAGLGEIGVQALRLDRRFSGCDLNYACVEIANARLLEHRPASAVV